MSEDINMHAFSQCYLTQLCSCTLCHVSLLKLWSRLQRSHNLSPSFQAYYSITPTRMSHNSSIMLNHCRTVPNNELSIWSTQCATASESILRPVSGWRWDDAVSAADPTAFMRTRCEDLLQFATIQTHDFFSPCTHAAWAVLNIMSSQTVVQTPLCQRCVKVRKEKQQILVSFLFWADLNCWHSFLIWEVKSHNYTLRKTTLTLDNNWSDLSDFNMKSKSLLL